MRVLIVHHESQYFAGAEKMLGYFLTGLAEERIEATVATTAQSRVREIIPSSILTCLIPSNARFSPLAYGRQVLALRRELNRQPYDLIHGWAARDWELVAFTARLTRTPALGTLHDHPNASFLSPARRRLMRWSVAGLDKVVCVSDAVRQACAAAGYAPAKLAVGRNGVPLRAAARPERLPGPCRLGFLGLFSERKGLRGLFRIVDQLAALTNTPWQLALAGDAQDDAGRALVGELKAEFSSRPWWPQVEWRGWVKHPLDFLLSIDVLICPSTEFDPFPTVLLEAGQAAVPVLAARVGGVPEIIEDGRTGWLFAPQAWPDAASKLKTVLDSSAVAEQVGTHARARIAREFTIQRMVADYMALYRCI